MSAYTSWAPQEFDEAALDTPVGREPPSSAAEHQTQYQGGAEEPFNAESGFYYDSNSGYYYHAASGYYYDANSGLYYDSSEQTWKAYDESSGQYASVSDQQEPSQEGVAIVSAGDTTSQGLSQLYAPEVEYKPPPEARKRGAVIGSAPRLNPEALRTAAREAQKREAEQKRLEALTKANPAKSRRNPASTPLSAGHAPALGGIARTPQTKQEGSAPKGVIKGVIRSSGKWGGSRASS